MKNISINPGVLVITLLVSAGLGALLTSIVYSKFDKGFHEGRMASQRDAARAISILMSEGAIVREADGSNVHVVLRPVVKPAP